MIGFYSESAVKFGVGVFCVFSFDLGVRYARVIASPLFNTCKNCVLGKLVKLVKLMSD